LTSPIVQSIPRQVFSNGMINYAISLINEIQHFSHILLYSLSVNCDEQLWLDG